MSHTVIQVDSLCKKYQLGVVGTGTLRHDLNRWWYGVRGKPDPYAIVGQHTGQQDNGTTRQQTNGSAGPVVNGPVVSSPAEDGPVVSSPNGHVVSSPEASGRVVGGLVVPAAPVVRSPVVAASAASARSALADDEIWALKNVSFEVKQGEIIGIIGRNGAGKSTLLKILSRVTAPTSGEVRVRGRIASLLEVGTGFHPELTGRENIFLNGTILGMSKTEIRKKLDEIIAFAEIEKFIDTPVKRYSSGMYVRLAFAVAAHLEPEILIVDEVLAVGDIAFQRKCLGKMGDAAKTGRTILFVSHNMAAINQLCPHSIWLEGGRIRAAGPTTEVVNAYVKNSNSCLDLAGRCYPEDINKDAQILRVHQRNEQNETTQQFHCDQAVFIEMFVQVRREVRGLYVYLHIATADGTRVMMSDSNDTVPNPVDCLPVGFYYVKTVIPPRTLAAGQYSVYVSLASHLAANFIVDDPEVVCSFNLIDLTSKRGNTRPGYFSTLLKWDTEPANAQEARA